jgi:DNA-directed RNA polymerase sigma subunit (sigma70/sigma32)
MSLVNEKQVQRRSQYIKGHDMTLSEVATYFGVHRNSVHETEVRALRKFKIEIEKRGYKMEDFFR